MTVDSRPAEWTWRNRLRPIDCLCEEEYFRFSNLDEQRVVGCLAREQICDGSLDEDIPERWTLVDTWRSTVVRPSRDGVEGNREESHAQRIRRSTRTAD